MERFKILKMRPEMRMFFSLTQNATKEDAEQVVRIVEAALHNAFADRKLNFVNQRREFFRVTLDEIKAVVRANFDQTVEFVDFPAAEQCRQSLAMASQRHS